MTVSQLAARIDQTLRDGLPKELAVRGQISNYSANHASGHHYFTLKDDKACIDCVIWKRDAIRVKFRMEDGLEALAVGRVGVYAIRGRYQFCITEIQPMGQGALELAFRQMCQKLEKEGLFAAERKKPLPAYPLRILLMTSQQTAALQDMLKVLRGFPWLGLMLCHVPVQGAAAGEEIAAALRRVNLRGGSSGGADVILLARGGGSLEDLWCFNEEAVARAVAGSRIAVITGIGHEIDTCIADLAADYRAHTPTEAAQVVVRHWRTAASTIDGAAERLRRGAGQIVRERRKRLAGIERHEAFRRPLYRVNMYRQLMDDREKALALRVRDRLRGLHRRLERLTGRLDRRRPSLVIAALRERAHRLDHRLKMTLRGRARHGRARLTALATRLAERHPRHRIHLARQRVAELEARLRRAAAAGLDRRAHRLEALSAHLAAVGPVSVLRRGFTLTFRKKGRQLIRSAAEVRPGDRLITRFADGELEWTAEDPRQPPLFS